MSDPGLTHGSANNTAGDVVRIVWRNGDEWRNFTPELCRGVHTIVTINGTSRILDIDNGTQRRVPLTDGHQMAGDGAVQSLGNVHAASPCGVYTTTVSGAWHATTPVVAVLAGDHPAWASGPDGQALLAEVSERGHLAPQHPVDSCDLPYCPKR
jgi:hypothetical protein